MSGAAKWPKISPVVKDWVIEYFTKCNKMGRPLRAKAQKPEIDAVKSVVLYMPVWGEHETCWVDNEIITVKVFSFYDSPYKHMIVTASTRSDEVDGHCQTVAKITHQADGSDIEWLERLVHERG